MNNSFYSSFDITPFGNERKPDYRTPFQIDRDRIVHTASFRRLQGKTQVFWPGEYDFYRTRLTHSLEVAQIGKAVAHYLSSTSNLLEPGSFIDPDLMEATCLAHDLGHPPFGHCGERALNDVMREFGGFEGNAQTLRLLTHIIYARSGKRTGMSPTRSFVDGVMKYKRLRSDHDVDHPRHHFLYEDQEEIRDFVHDGNSYEPLAWPKSLECQIMDWADDIAYSIHDLSDGIKAGFLTATTIEKWCESASLSSIQQEGLNEWLSAIKQESLAPLAARKIGEFISAAKLRQNPSSSLDSLRYRFRLEIEDGPRQQCQAFVAMASELVYQSPRVHQLEFKGRRMLTRIFEVLAENYIDRSQTSWHLLPKSLESMLEAEDERVQRARWICDYIAGMTDSFAIRTYKRLFDPDFGSIVDLV